MFEKSKQTEAGVSKYLTQLKPANKLKPINVITFN